MANVRKLVYIFLLWSLLHPAYAQDLPEIGYFNLSAGGGKVYLSWQLQAGATCFGITVHRSADGQEFDPIGGIEGVCGDLSNPESYSFTDEDPPLNQRVFYRLELGTGNFTETRYIDVIDLQGDAFQVRPNPVTSVSAIFFLNPGKEIHTLTLTDLQGRILYRQDTREDRFPIHASDLAKGLYLFSIESSGKAGSMTGKIIVMP